MIVVAVTRLPSLSAASGCAFTDRPAGWAGLVAPERTRTTQAAVFGRN